MSLLWELRRDIPPDASLVENPIDGIPHERRQSGHESPAIRCPSLEFSYNRLSRSIIAHKVAALKAHDPINDTMRRRESKAVTGLKKALRPTVADNLT